MKQTFTRFGLSIMALAWLLTGVGCKSEPAPMPLSAGVLELSEYAAWGDGYTAGFAQAGLTPHSLPGLFPAGQQQAYPALLAQQLALVDSEVSFVQHLTTGNGSGYYALEELEADPCEGQPPAMYRELRQAYSNWSAPGPTPPDNLGVPYLPVAAVHDPNRAYQDPFAQRINLQGSYVQAMAQHPGRFYTLWLGLSDVMGYAMTGTASATYSPTPGATFARHLADMLRSLNQNRASPVHLLLGNLPDPTQFPYFQALPHRYVSAEDCNSWQQPVYYQEDPAETIHILSEHDRLLLPAQPQIGKTNRKPGLVGLHRDNPLPDELVLTQAELAEVQTIIQDYNRRIDSVARHFNDSLGYSMAVVVDLYQQFAQLDPGLTIDGAPVSSHYLSGGIFEADGHTLTPKGQAYVANAFIEAINQTSDWDAGIPLLNLANYPGVRFP